MKSTENINQLITELDTLRKRVYELEQYEAERTICENTSKKTEEAFLQLFNSTEEIAFSRSWTVRLSLQTKTASTFIRY